MIGKPTQHKHKISKAIATLTVVWLLHPIAKAKNVAAQI